MSALNPAAADNNNDLKLPDVPEFPIINNSSSFNDDDSSSSLERQLQQNGGVLSQSLLVENLSHFGRTASGDKFAYLNLSLPGCDLVDISLIGTYKEIQTLDLSYNRIKDLSVLSELKYLVVLNVSNNRVNKLFDFLTPYNLKEAFFAFNNIREIGNLSNYHYLQTLDLSHNKIERIDGLDYCQRLRNLNLSNNLITKIEGLNNLPLTNLSLAGNKIKKIEGLNSLPYLRQLDLSSNNIRSLKGIPERHQFLEKLFLQDNKIYNVADLDHLVNLKLLRTLSLKANPIREVEHSRLIILFKMPRLETLDGKKVETFEKVNANDMFFPSVEYIAARDHMTNLVFHTIQDHKVKESTLPDVNSPYPILILCGVEGSGSQELALKLVKEFPDYFNFVPLHTTKKVRSNEKDKLYYKYMGSNEFDEDVLHGKFICCNEYFGDWYGVKWDSVESVAAQGLACVVQMELESLISFKKTYFEPRCVLVTTLDRTVQCERLKDQAFTEFECEVAKARAEWYEDYNGKHPGFFDAVIITDNMGQGFTTLKNLVLNYLGLSSIEHIYNPNIQSGEFESKNSSMHTNFTRSADKKLHPSELQRTDSFLPSNTATGNRSQLSHVSMESLSQMYSQSMRLKFGSAPAELQQGNKGEHAERSLMRRIREIKRQFESNNLVNSKSQIENTLMQHHQRGVSSTTATVNSSYARLKGASMIDEENSKSKTVTNKKKTVSDSSNDDDDDDFID